MNRKKLIYILILVLMFINVACSGKKEGNGNSQKEYRGILTSMLDTGALTIDDIDYIHENSQKIVKEHSDENSFAVADIDDDGSDELIIEFAGLSTVENKAYVFDYREQKGVYCEAEFFCRDTRFYEGCAQVNAAKNQGPSGDLWPYALYKYYPQYDAYAYVGYAGSWDSRYYEMFFNKPFPQEYDLNKDGVVYTLSFAEASSERITVDNAEYEKWRAAFVDEGTKKELDFLPITRENVKEVFGE